MRISTGQMWDSALSNLMAAQMRQNDANNQVSSQKIATDLGGFGRTSEVIASYQSSLTRIEAYVGVSKSVSDRLDSQNIALERASDGISTAKDAIFDAIANDNLDSLMTSLQSSYMAFADGMNYKHQGQYLFGGGQDTIAPLAADSLTELAALTPANTFVNGSVKKASKIDATTTLQTGMLASELDNGVTGLFRQIQTFAVANAPLTGKMTDAQQTFLQDMSTQLSAAYDKVVNATSLNGAYQNRVENTLSSLESQAISLESLLSDKTDVNMAEAYTRLEQADLAVQASAKVVANLSSTSLLDLLR